MNCKTSVGGEVVGSSVPDLQAVCDEGNVTTTDINAAIGLFTGAIGAGGAAIADGAAAINDFVGGDVGTNNHGCTLLTSSFAEFGSTGVAGVRNCAWVFRNSISAALYIGGGGARLNFGTTYFTPGATNAFVAGSTTKRFKDAYYQGVLYLGGTSTTTGIYHGTGTPEGAQAAAVGSLFLRADGGTDTAVYRKETGAAGNTGWVAIAAGGLTPRQESVTTENITGTDTALADTLDNTPVSNASVSLYLNGIFQEQGAGADYTISGTTITWLASTGTAVDMTISDTLTAVYAS